MYPGIQKAYQTSLGDVFTSNNSLSLRNRPVVRPIGQGDILDWPKPNENDRNVFFSHLTVLISYVRLYIETAY